MINQKLIDAIALFDKDIFTNSPNQLRLIIDAARENEQLRKERDELLLECNTHRKTEDFLMKRVETLSSMLERK